jgi:hypothetical protein
MKKIYSLITKDNWCRGYLALDKNNKEVNITDPAACKFCAEGWLQFIYKKNYHEKLHKVRQHLAVLTLHGWNDNPKTTFKKVKQAFFAADL